jgi:hypothetical protein
MGVCGSKGKPDPNAKPGDPKAAKPGPEKEGDKNASGKPKLEGILKDNGKEGENNKKATLDELHGSKPVIPGMKEDPLQKPTVVPSK